MTRRRTTKLKKSEKDPWKNWGDHPVIVAIGTVSSLIAIVIGIITFFPKNTSSKGNESQSLTSTPNAPSTINATKPTFNDPNPTSTPYFATIPTPTNVLFYDDFSDPTSGWSQEGYTNGWYKILYDTWHEKSFYTWENVGTIDGTFVIRVTVIGPFEKNGFASRGVIFGSDRGNNFEPFSFSFDKDGKCKISRYSTDSDFRGWHKMLEGQVENFDSQKSFYTLELLVSNYRQVKGIVDGKMCIDTVLDYYTPGFVGLYASATYAGSDYVIGESFFDDFYVFRP